MNKAQGRQHSKKKNYYAKQFERTAANKVRRAVRRNRRAKVKAA